MSINSEDKQPASGTGTLLNRAYSMRLVKAVLLAGGGLMIVVLVLVLSLLLFAPEPTRYGLTASQFEVEELDAPAPLERINVPSAPNVVFILADDLGYGDIEAFGETPIRTPNLNRLAVEGVRFTNFYAPAPVCSPSRAGFLTGRYPLRMGLSFPIQPATEQSFVTWVVGQATTWLAALGVLDMKSGDNLTYGLPPHEITIAEGLREAGYAAGVVGKWHLGDFTARSEYHPFNHGFEFFVGFNASNDDWPVAYFRGETMETPDIGLDQEQYTRLFTDEAVGFIEENKDGPFFLFFSHKDPHQPFFPSEKFIDQSDAGRYGDVVEELDASVGTVLDTLDRLSLSENTLVIFTSDNGPWFEGDAEGLRGRKGMSNEGGYRVPFLMRYPTRLNAGTTFEYPAMGIDLLPTVFSLAGLALPSDRIVDGRSLFTSEHQLISGEVQRDFFFASGFDFEAVRRGDLKFIERNSGYSWPIPLDKQIGIAEALEPLYTSPNGEVIERLNAWPKLYNLARDEAEAYDISDAHPDEVSELNAALSQWRADFLANPTGFHAQEGMQ